MYMKGRLEIHRAFFVLGLQQYNSQEIGEGEAPNSVSSNVGILFFVKNNNVNYKLLDGSSLLA